MVVLVGTLVASPAWAELKIGVVDYGRLVEESPQAKSALESIRTEFTPRQRDLQNQQASLKSKEDRLQKDGATMSPDQRTNSEKDLRDSYRELQRKQQEVQDDFNARRNEEMSRLQKSAHRAGSDLRQGAELRPGHCRWRDLHDADDRHHAGDPGAIAERAGCQGACEGSRGGAGSSAQADR